MDNIENIIDSLGFSFGCVYKYITNYSDDYGIVVIGTLTKKCDKYVLFSKPLYVKFSLPPYHKGKRIKKDEDGFEINVNMLSRLSKLNRKEYLLYSIIKKI